MKKKLLAITALSCLFLAASTAIFSSKAAAEETKYQILTAPTNFVPLPNSLTYNDNGVVMSGLLGSAGIKFTSTTGYTGEGNSAQPIPDHTELQLTKDGMQSAFWKQGDMNFLTGTQGSDGKFTVAAWKGNDKKPEGIRVARCALDPATGNLHNCSDEILLDPEKTNHDKGIQAFAHWQELAFNLRDKTFFNLRLNIYGDHLPPMNRLQYDKNHSFAKQMFQKVYNLVPKQNTP